MPATLLRKLSRLAPPEVRRAASGLLLDIRSLPSRFADPARRSEPWRVMHDVGDGDYGEVGRQIAGWLRAYAGLAEASVVLDIGCGTGRVAAPLAEILGPAGRYVGFDVSKPAIQFCQLRFAEDPRFAFHRQDVYNGYYNRSGDLPERGVRFPAPDASVDVAFATSVFTHMRLGAVRTYMAEAARTLRPGGRFLFSVFALEPGRERSQALEFRPFEAGSAVVNHRSPEQAIAHRRDVLAALVAEAGLATETVLRGQWRPPADYEGGQDLWVAAKPAQAG